MIKNKNIIIVGQQAWDIEIGCNSKDIAIEFSKHNRVLYVNAALDRATKFRKKKDPKIQKRLNVINGTEDGIVQIADNLYNLYPDCMVESINWINSTRIFDWLNKYNNKKFARSILAATRKLGFDKFILFNDNDMFRSYYLKEYLKPTLAVYYSRDNMLGVNYWKKHGTLLEPRLISKSDVCIANSEYLSNQCKKYNPLSFFVGQGCDFSMFDNGNLEEPEDLKNIRRPIIGYVGALLASRLDISLLENLSTKRPDWSFVLVGPEDEAFQDSLLHKMPNVHFTGGKDPSAIPAYINAFDICMNPQYLNPITIGNYPRKIDEYLVLGKPTIATKTESMGLFKDYVALASNASEYIEGIEQLLSSDNEELARQRRAFALTHTWENSIELISRAFEKAAAEKGIQL
ncbi:MAG: glycosyltransferase [Niabella sp.]